MAFALAIVYAAGAAALFAYGFVRLRRRGRRDLAGWDRAVLFALALALGVFALSPPVEHAADKLLAGHMLEHLLIGDAAIALLLVSVRGPLLLFVLPPSLLRVFHHTRWLRSFIGTLFRPSVAFAVWAGSLAIWHIPAFYDSALGNAYLHALQHTCFMLGGTLVWAQLIDPARRRALEPRQRLAYAFGMFVAGQALANTLILTYTPLYPAYAAEPQRMFGLSPLADQDAAALVMMGEQILTLGTFAAIQLRRWLRTPTLVAVPARHPFVT